MQVSNDERVAFFKGKAEEAQKVFKDLQESTREEAERMARFRECCNSELADALVYLDECEKIAALFAAKLTSMLESMPLQPSNDQKMLSCAVNALSKATVKLTQRRVLVEGSVFRDIPLGVELLMDTSIVSAYLARKKTLLSFKVWLTDSRGKMVHASMFRGAVAEVLEVEGSTDRIFQMNNAKAACIVNIQKGISSFTTTQTFLDASVGQLFRLAIKPNGSEKLGLPVFSHLFTISSTRNKRRRISTSQCSELQPVPRAP